ncbi:MAG: hypothetical protein HC936_14265 [Leptolyngbyaceae cyanobacterium SU_3_3]|nr:hypothetical protein [Leptolyngbyaceae cyanobacterium SU_3_3]
MTRSPNKKIVAGFWVSLAALTGIGILSYSNLIRYVEASRRVSHTQKVLGKTDFVLLQLREAEVGQRGYLLTTDPNYLEPYHQAKTTLKQEIDILRKLTANAPNQQRRVAKLHPLIDAKLDELQQTIVLQESQNPGAALAIVRSHQGKNLTEQIRTILEEIKAEESQVLEQRSQAEQTQLLAISALTIPGCLAIALFLEVTILQLRHALRQRKQGPAHPARTHPKVRAALRIDSRFARRRTAPPLARRPIQQTLNPTRPALLL